MVLQTQWSDWNNLWFLHQTPTYSLVLWKLHYTLIHSLSTSYLQRYTWYTLSKVIRLTYMRGWAREVIFPYTLGARRPSLVLGHHHYFRQNTDSTVSSPRCHLWNRQTIVILITGTDNYHLQGFSITTCFYWFLQPYLEIVKMVLNTLSAQQMCSLIAWSTPHSQAFPLSSFNRLQGERPGPFYHVPNACLFFQIS